MFTGRAEFRLSLRSDNADLRLTQKGYDQGVVSQERYSKFSQYRNIFQQSIAYLQSITNSISYWKKHIPSLPCDADKPANKSLFDLLKINEINLKNLEAFLLKSPECQYFLKNEKLAERLKIHCQYLESEKRQIVEINDVKLNESILLPLDFDYKQLSLSREIKEKLLNYKPTSLGAASRIPGMTPAALLSLLRFFKNQKSFE